MANDPQPTPKTIAEPWLPPEEQLLLTKPLPHEMSEAEMESTWAKYQSVIGPLMVRMGVENNIVDALARVALVGTLDGIYARLALIPKLGYSALHALRNHRPTELIYRLAGECMLMELSAAAGYRTFCFPDLVKGLLKTGKMRDQPVTRMMDTFEFLNTMVRHPLKDERVQQQFARTNHLHGKYKVAGAHNPQARDLFKYIALNMFYIGPSMRPDLTPQERHAICGLTVLVSKRMGHEIEGSVLELESFIRQYEDSKMFDPADTGVLRRRAVEIAQASKVALDRIPTISAARIHSFVPYKVKKILEIT